MQLSSLLWAQHALKNCGNDLAEDRNLTHDVEASGGLEMWHDPAGDIFLFYELLPEILFLLVIGGVSYFFQPVDTL